MIEIKYAALSIGEWNPQGFEWAPISARPVMRAPTKGTFTMNMEVNQHGFDILKRSTFLLCSRCIPEDSADASWMMVFDEWFKEVVWA